MFNSIEGVVTGRSAASARLATGGVEWEFAMPASDAAALPPEGERGKVYTWLYHREDAMSLIGFVSEERRTTFLELLKVEGIGVKGALKIMGGISQQELLRALERDDLERLSSVPGLGKKTAQKMLLSLKGKLVRREDAGPAPGPWGELAEALAGMGYERKAAAAALDKADKETPEEEQDRENQVFRKAIVYLSR